jgi:Mg2+-importing ATPase
MAMECVEKVGRNESLAISVDELLSRLKTGLSGLTGDEASERLEEYGPNEIARRKRRMAILDFLYFFRNPLIIVLLVAGVISGVLGDVTEAVIIFVMVLLSAVINFYQETSAESAAEALRNRVTTTATVLRDGLKKETDMSLIVPGDVVFLSAGDAVPADCRVILAKDFFVDQSAITGESYPVEKNPLPCDAAELSDCRNFVFFGSSVVSGSATVVVLRTGKSTEYGKIAKKLISRKTETEFERGLRRFSLMMMEVILVLVLFVFFVNALGAKDVLQSFLFSVALAVGLTPELLPMIVSVNLSKGAINMSKKKVIVRSLASIQNFGSMDVLCTDKTGTLTENRIKLILHIDPKGNESDKVFLYSFLNSYYETGLKSPLDRAVIEHGDVDALAYHKVDEIPFDFVRKRVSIVVEKDRERTMITKGSPEEILDICTSCDIGDGTIDISDELIEELKARFNDLSAQGFRILGVVYKRVNEKKEVYSIDDEREMVFAGFIAFIDPPKESAKQSIKLLRDAGIKLKILTGDNELVTKKICSDLDFEIDDLLLGKDISPMNDDALAIAVEKTNVFARVTPAQKDRIMNALKINGHVVGYIGDGINDAPSMRTADVSISVDNAVDVAKEAADMVLLEKDLKVLYDGVIEGRKTFGNTMKYIMMGTSSNFGNMFSMAIASLFLPFLPMAPGQILLNNLLYDISEIAIPTDAVDEQYAEKPKRMDVSFIRRFMLYFGPISSVFDLLTFYIMLTFFKAGMPQFQTAWFVESLCTQMLVVFSIRTERIPFYRSRPSGLLLFSGLCITSLAIVIPFTPLGGLLGFVALPWQFFLILLALVVSYLVLVEVMKVIFYKRSRQPAEPKNI